MVGPNFMDEIDCGSFFDHIDDLLDFPVEEVEGITPTLPAAAAAAAGNCNSLASIWPAGADSFPGSDSVFSGNSASDLSAELSVPYEDIVQLEWLSNFVEDSFCGGSLTMKKVEEPSCITKEDSVHNQFHTSSPVSVLESSSSCSGGKTVPPPPRSPEVYIPVPCGRARSKRPRPATFNPRPAMNLISPASSFVGENIQPNVISPKTSSDSENFAESQLVAKMPKQVCGEPKKKKKVKVTVPAGGGDSNQNGLQAVRKCMHCEITKTPQWRAGPMGPKTLCNACGVRFKSGRLYPEYRPAASPTFCPSLHSNSHKKVLEMRCRGIEKSGFAMNNVAASPELIPNTNSSLSLEYI
ncbi:hypothetical protein LR48_Vigan2558s000100 [Vigna angularis]|nr:GATA transcription factor 8 [Vigna angularis]XP_017411889.1 GATA transcription factor 8 [Vigna angularis]KOM24816.1 hypothetical protein LR48_Vigan2558s000100 [Vigna angularis]BAT94475.1 hypothetical protein VIGAN_08108200 [Vigna angularis var. angularis]